jgi:hypothetical protein
VSAIVLLSGAVFGQGTSSQYSDYKWATKLADAPYGFDDMAESVFNRMASSSKVEEKLLGRTGIADLKRKQARSAVGLDAKLKLLDEAIVAIRGVKKEWPNKAAPEYFDVIFKVADMLQQRGEIAMESALDPATAPAKSDELKNKASGDFTEAKTDLDAIRQQFKNVSAETDRANWEVRAQAWLTYNTLLIAEAEAAKDGSVQQGTALAEAARELDDFVLEHESGDDVQSMLYALFGQIYSGKVARLRKEMDKAIASYESVLGYVKWDTGGEIDGAVQNLVELAYLEMLSGLNAERRFEDTRAKGEEMERRFVAKKMDVGVRGRAARVEFARACFEAGDFGRALVVSSEVARAGRNDPSAIRAAKLISQVIASAPDKRQFDPEVLLNAAKGAYQESLADPTKRGEAVAYYRMAIPLLDRIKDEKLRYETAVSAWIRYADCLQSDGLLLEAALACIEGYRATWVAKKDLLQAEDAKAEVNRLFTKLKRAAEEFNRETKSPEGAKLTAEFNDLLAKHAPPDSVFSPGDIKFEEAQKLEREGKLDEAIKAYHEVSGKPPEYKDGLGGRFVERAIVKANGCAATAAKKLMEKRDPKALAALEAAVTGFEAYLKLAADPNRKETDPTKVQARKDAQAEAKWRLSDLKIDLAAAQTDEAKKKQMCRDVVTLLVNFEQLHPEQQNLAIFAAANRVEALLLAGDITQAKAAFVGLEKIGATHLKMGEVANKLGKAIKAGVDERKKALDPKNVAEIEKLFPEAIEAAGYYKTWLLQPGNGKSQKVLANWEAVARMYFDHGGLSAAADLYREILEKFGSLSSSKPDDLNRCRYYLARANDKLAEQLVIEGKDASRLFAETGALMSDFLMKDDSRYKAARDVWRIAARTWGGFLFKKGANLTYFPGLGDYAKAFDVWKSKIKVAAESGSEDWWEATFYQYYLALKEADINKDQKAKDDLQKSFKSLRSTSSGEFGGGKWRDAFLWLERQIL